jgi:hypothetical protein
MQEGASDFLVASATSKQTLHFFIYSRLSVDSSRQRATNFFIAATNAISSPSFPGTVFFLFFYDAHAGIVSSPCS